MLVMTIKYNNYVDKFINSQKKYNNMSKNDIEKCAFNNYFNFSYHMIIIKVLKFVMLL